MMKNGARGDDSSSYSFTEPFSWEVPNIMKMSADKYERADIRRRKVGPTYKKKIQPKPNKYEFIMSYRLF